MLDHDNRVSLVTRDANMEGKGAIGLSQLICATHWQCDLIALWWANAEAEKSWTCCAR